MADLVLDYSSGWPRTLSWRTKDGVLHTAIGVVRYVGTPGRGKNLTKAEADHWKARGVPIALVYEGGAGWMTGGRNAGRAAAQLALADAAACGVQVRCVYLAADFDVTTSAQMAAIDACLDGAAEVLDRGRVGVYGEADVIDHCVTTGKATYGWQTRAWSRGRASVYAHIRQELGYVYPDGVEADFSTVLKADWGQHPHEGIDMPLTDADAKLVAKALVPYLQEITTGAGNSVDNNPLLQQLRDTQDAGIQGVSVQLEALDAAVATISSAIVALASKVEAMSTGGGVIDLAALAKAVVDEEHRRLEA